MIKQVNFQHTHQRTHLQKIQNIFNIERDGLFIFSIPKALQMWMDILRTMRNELGLLVAVNLLQQSKEPDTQAVAFQKPILLNPFFVD